MAAIRPVCACRRRIASPAATFMVEKRFARRSSRAASWALPSLGLALVPKCPMCIAAWLALGGSFGVSLTAASYLRSGFVWLCWDVLALMTARLVFHFSYRTHGIPSGK